MILFSQQPTLHSRIGNSLSWMARALPILKKHSIDASFPWAIENFANYLQPKSFWMRSNPDASSKFKQTFSKQLNAVNLSSVTRNFEYNYEIEHGLEPFKWEKLIVKDNTKGILYLTGKLDISNFEIIKLIKDYDLCICHEPFNFLFNEEDDHDYHEIQPKLNLIEEESFLMRAMGANKKDHVGLHIRRGDYSLYANGGYFYDDEFWISLIKKLIDQNKVVHIFSNELSISFAERIERAGAHIANRNFEGELVRLMLMDEIYGPPSSFSSGAVVLARNLFKKEIKYTEFPHKNQIYEYLRNL